MVLLGEKNKQQTTVFLMSSILNALLSGSNDGGITVRASDPKFNEIMEKVGKHLNLKKHTVGRQRTPIIGPGDIEGQ